MGETKQKNTYVSANSYDAAICFNETGTVTDCDSTFFELFNADVQDKSVPFNFYSFMPEFQPDGRISQTFFKNLVQDTFAQRLGSKNTEFSWLFKRADGRYFQANVTLAKVDGADGGFVSCHISAAYDEFAPSEGLQSRNISYEISKEIAAILNHAPGIIFFIDKHLNILECNQFALDAFSLLKKEDFINNFFSDFVPKFQSSFRADDLMRLQIKRAASLGSVQFDWNIKRGPEEVPGYIKLVSTSYQGIPCCVAYLTEFAPDAELYFDKSQESGLPGESIMEAMQIAENSHLRIILDSIPAICTFWNEKREAIMCNQPAADLFGLLGPQEFLDRFDELSPEFQPCGSKSKEKFSAFLDQAFETGYCKFEWMHQKPDGTPIPAEVSLTRINWEEGHRLVGFTVDLRESKKIEQEQTVAKERVLAMINASPLMCFVCDAELNVLDCNDRVPYLLDWDSKQTFIDNFTSFFPVTQPDGKDSQEAIGEYFNAAFENDSTTFEWSFLRANGELLPVEVSTTLTELDGRNVLVVYCRDLREAALFNEERRAALEHIEVMLDASPLACSILDDQFNILDCNESVVELFGLENKEDFASNFLQLHPETQPDGKNSLEKLKENTARAFAEGSRFTTFEWMFQTLTGDLVPSQITLKPVAPDDKNLMAAYIQDLRHIKQAALAAEALEKLAYTDSLTGANNRRYFVEVAERELKNSIAEGHPFTLIMLDIDNFKGINDNFGHVVGDGVLKILVSRIRHTLRKNVVVARYGGEEFVVLMPGIPEDAAERTAWRIRRNIEGSKFLVEGAKVPVTVSMGVAGRDDGDANLTDIISKADKALYQAKTGGKNTVVQYDESMVHQFSEANLPDDKQSEDKQEEKKQKSQGSKKEKSKGGNR